MRTAIDLFAGVGGLSLGFEQAGFKIVWANEFNKSIADAYKKIIHILLLILGT